MSEPAHGLRRGWLAAAGLAAVAAFAVLAGRFWHPFYGFTRFIQLDEADARSGIHEIREHPVFVYDGFNGYDGAAYAQVAFHPLLDSVELQPAVGNVPYRARRILGSALAWLLAAADPSRIANTYAALNLGVWLLCGALLWRVLPVVNAKTWLAWCGVMFSAGALHSVRLALTDLLAATLVIAAVWLGERGRARTAIGALALAGLARETALAAVAGLWNGPWTTRRPWQANLLRAVLVAVPLAAWMIYVRWKAGPAAQGFGNFTWPMIGWLEKWTEITRDFREQPAFRWLTITTLLAFVGLTVQVIYLARRWRAENPWWRAGITGVTMFLLLGTSVWEGHPGAATRVLLPMSAAFAVLAARERAAWGWIVGGSLGVFSGILALWHVPHAAREVAAGRFSGGAYVAQIGEGWHGIEYDGRHVWAWAAQRAAITVRVAGGPAPPLRVQLALRAITPREIEVRAGETVVWSGKVGEKLGTLTFAVPPPAGGRIDLQIASSTAPQRENQDAGARALGFAVYGVSVQQPR